MRDWKQEIPCCWWRGYYAGLRGIAKNTIAYFSRLHNAAYLHGWRAGKQQVEP